MRTPSHCDWSAIRRSVASTTSSATDSVSTVPTSPTDPGALWFVRSLDRGATYSAPLELDKGPKTIMGLIRSQLTSFPSDKKADKDDIIDGLGLAYKLAQKSHVVVGSPRETALEAQQLVAQRRGGLRGGLRGGGRRS